jgi:hypothetical protein
MAILLIPPAQPATQAVDTKHDTQIGKCVDPLDEMPDGAADANHDREEARFPGCCTSSRHCLPGRSKDHGGAQALGSWMANRLWITATKGKLMVNAML